MDRLELFGLTVGSFRDYSEVKHNIHKILNLYQDEVINKYKVSKTAKSYPEGILYISLENAKREVDQLGNEYNVYKLIRSRGRSGTYWVRVY